MQNLEESGTSDVSLAHQLDDSDRSELLFDQAFELWEQYKKFWRKEDLEESIRLDREALVLRPEGHPDRDDSLNNLASSLNDRYHLSHQREDLDDSIRLDREALALRPEGHPYHHYSLYNLASSLRDRFRLSHQQEDLDDSIRLDREALDLRPEGHPNRDDSLNNLAVSLSDRYHLNHQQEDLDDSIRLHREALALRPEGHPDRHHSLANLASSLRDRFLLSHQQEDLDDSIRLHREALALRPEGHPYHHYSLNNLANSLRDRFRLSHQQGDLDDSIRLYREALALRPEGHSLRDSSLYNLASSLRDRFLLSHQQEDLDDSIRLHREALALRPEGHPKRDNSLGNLANSLADRFNQRHQLEDLDECIALEHAELDLRPEGHPARSQSLNSLAIFLWIRFEQTNQLDGLEESMKLRKSAALHLFSSSLERLEGAVNWAAFARKHDHISALEAYDIALSLLQRTLTLSPTLRRQHDLLVGRSYPTLALDAASYAIEKGDIKRAVEMLEQGRGLLWSQMRGFRTPIDSLAKVDPSLADRLKDITTQLDTLSTTPDMQRDISSNAFANSNTFDEMLKRKRQLSEEQEIIVEEIRLRPGFCDFLKYTSFAMLQNAADEGPVIIINHCKYRSDCIIVLKEAEPVCIPLAETVYEEAQDQAIHLYKARKEKLRSYPRMYDHILQSVLGWLWRDVVSLVVDKLTELGIPKQSRIWLCPTSVLTSLPFHAAGPSGAIPVRYLIDDYIPSYTATLQALIDARVGFRPINIESIVPPSLLVIGQPGKERPLPNVSKEINVIRKHASAVSALYLEEERSTKEMVMENIRNKTWVHFACHGHLKPGQPFDSSFELFDEERLTLLNIIKNRLPNAELAFLSACHSAEQTTGSAHDEVLHLAAGMQFCGYRSVIGTMWEMNDEDGPFVVEHFYKRMLPKKNAQRVGYKGSARALQKSILLLRAQEVSVERWVNFIHIGA